MRCRHTWCLDRSPMAHRQPRNIWGTSQAGRHCHTTKALRLWESRVGSEIPKTATNVVKPGRVAEAYFSGAIAESTQPRRSTTMSTSTTSPNTPEPRPAVAIRPPNKHQLALMIWIAVFPTLTVINLVFGDWLRPMTPVLRTFVLATVAVPIVIYGLMPQLHRVRARLETRASSSR